jgi:hypothetical protein
MSLEVVSEIMVGRATIIVYKDQDGHIVLGGWNWTERYDYDAAAAKKPI